MNNLMKEIEEVKKQLTHNAEIMEERFQCINERMGSNKVLLLLMSAGLLSGYLLGRFSRSRKLAFSLIKNQIIVKNAVGFLGKAQLTPENDHNEAKITDKTNKTNGTN